MNTFCIMDNLNNGNGPVSQGPQYAPPQRVDNSPMPPKKKNGWRTALLIGCGFMLGIAAVVVVFALLMMKECNDKNQDRTTPLIKDLKVEESLVLKNKLDSNQIKELVPRGMPKDSVLIVLGKPDDYVDANWGDYVRYDINDSTGVQIDFINDVVDNIQFDEFVPEEALN